MKTEQNIMDAAVLEILERKIKQYPNDEDLKRLYSVTYNAIHFDELTKEKKEAVVEEAKEWDSRLEEGDSRLK